MKKFQYNMNMSIDAIRNTIKKFFGCDLIITDIKLPPIKEKKSLTSPLTKKINVVEGKRKIKEKSKPLKMYQVKTWRDIRAQVEPKLVNQQQSLIAQVIKDKGEEV